MKNRWMIYAHHGLLMLNDAGDGGDGGSATAAATDSASAASSASQGEPTRLPDDHPLVTAFAAQKAELADFKQRQKDAEDATKSDIEKATTRAEAAESELAGYKTREQVAKWAAEIVKDTPIPASALRGSTKEELTTHFEELKALVPAGPTTRIPGNGRPAGQVTQVQTTEESREDRKKRIAESYQR